MCDARKMLYQIRLRGHLDAQWSSWFENADIEQEAEDVTQLTCAVSDQAALYGLLKKVRDLGLPLLSLVCLEPADFAESSSLISVKIKG